MNAIATALQLFGFLAMTFGLYMRPSAGTGEIDSKDRFLPMVLVGFNSPKLFWSGWGAMVLGLAIQCATAIVWR